MPDFFADPILNSPYGAPTRHWELDGEGRPTGRIVESRRRTEFIAAVPGRGAERQPDLLADLTDETALQTAIAELRAEVDRWRALPNPLDWRVTAETRRLLLHWRDPAPEGLRPFFCQVEAAEIAIWLAEVAPQRARSERLLERLRGVNEAANPGLFRLALKLATSAGKTTVMAMLIAWQTVNAVRYPRRGFSKGFLVVTPGITIRDRLRVLQPNDPDSYYRQRGLVPADMLEDMQQAKIVITNYHAFKPRQTMEVTPGGRKALAGHGDEAQTAETEDRMVDRVCGDLKGLKDVAVINDEAHHCYRVRPEAATEERGRSDEAREARENNEAARLWIAGLEAVQRQMGIRTVYDLSATPFFLSGSGYPAGSLFPWVVSDFSLIDAIECGVVKLPRVPVSDNLPSGAQPLYRNLWPTVRDRMPTGTRGAQRLDPQNLPLEVKNALDALYGHYEKTYDLWDKARVGVPPVFIVVCANTVASELVYEYISGYHRTDEHEQTTFFPARFDLFSNFGRDTGDPFPVPRTLLIDSIQIEKGDTIDDAFRKAAAEEIERFRRDKRAREGAAAAEKLTDAELLREAMNTVGRKGRLGEQIRCVVSVGMLTEGWDANTVTHILGLRAFGSRLLCEQVMGRALRRLSYDLHDTPDGPRYRVEYADIMGIDRLNLAPQDAVIAKPVTPRPMVRVEAVTPDRDACEIRFPRVEGYRVELPDTAIQADWSKIEAYVLTPEKVGPCEIEMRGIVGAPERLTLDHLRKYRDNEIILKLTGHLVFQKLRDTDDLPIATLIPKIKPIVRRFLEEFVTCTGGTAKAQRMHLQLADEVAEIILGAINMHHAGTEAQPIRAVLAPYAPVGSTLDVGFNTASEDRHAPNPYRSHVNWIEPELLLEPALLMVP
jgi:type III restriction enzyme